MCKAVDKTMEIGKIRLCTKKGGKSGDFVHPGETTPGGGTVS
jgi:cyclic pyranopterin phosphate synthase